MKTSRKVIALLRGAVAAVMFATLPVLAQTTLNNPLNPQFSTIPNFISGALKVMVMVSLPIITLFIVYAGFKFVSARGNPGELESAKNNFVYVILGALLILGAWIIATLIGGTVSQLVGS